ncbi:MAG: 2-hydroxyacid dehydrogenase [Pirellulaceae bacterium]|nr:2-hydroxyacid dehydrogenase [Pirellulaceae bacterium]
MAIARPVVVIPGDDPPMIAGSRHLDRLRERADVVLYTTRPASDDEKIARAGEAEVILNSRGIVRWPGSVLRRLPRLRLISCCAIGYDCVEMAAAAELGITVTNVPGRTATMVAEHALALLLGAARRVAWMTSEIKQQRWPGMHLVALHGKRLGVIGTGNIGREMIRLGRAIGMEVVAWSFHPQPDHAQRLGFRYVELAELLATSDAISIHLALSDQTRGLIGRRAFEQMKPGTILVNTARGAIVDQAALVEALESEKLAGAGLDVFPTEPLAANDPLFRCSQVVLTSHAADQLPEAFDALAHGAVDNVLAFLAGQPTNVVR